MSRIVALCFLLLAAVLGFLHIDSRPVWAPFSAPDFPHTEEAVDEAVSTTTKTKAPPKLVAPTSQANWLPDTERHRFMQPH